MRYSVYVFLDERGKPYYVGKTNNMVRRRREHLKEIADGNPLPKYAKARDLMKKGHKLKMKRVASFTREEDALSKEKKLISIYRSKPGIKLTNLTTGGANERPTNFDGSHRKAAWYTGSTAKPKRRVKKSTRKLSARKITKKRRR